MSTWHRQTRRALGANGTSALLSTALSAALLIAMARAGRFAEIGAFTAGTVAVSIAAAGVGMGASMQYVVASSSERQDLEQWRLRRAFPALVLVAALTALVYGARGFRATDVGAAGLAVALNHLAELHYSQLQADLRFVTAGAVVVGSKLGVIVASLSLPLSLSGCVLGAAVVQLAVLEYACARRWITLSRRRGKDGSEVRRPQWPLATYSLADAAAARVDSALVAVFYSPATTGKYAVVYAVFTGCSSVLYSGVQVLLPLHRRALEFGYARTAIIEIQRLIVVVAGGVAVVCWLGAPAIISYAVGRRDPEAILWLRVLIPALPFLILARSVALRAIAGRDFATARKIVLASTLLGAVAYVILIPTAGVVGGPIGTLMQESLSCWIALRTAKETE